MEADILHTMSETQLSLSFYDDAALKKMPETDIIDAILGRHAPLERDIMPAAMAAVGAAIQSTAGLGQLLEEIYQRHKGGKWEEVYAKLNMPFTFVQANRFRQQWVNRDKVIFASEPSPLALTNAYRHAELLPEPEPQPKSDLPPMPFTLKFSFDTSREVNTWGKENVVDFLQRTEKIEVLRTKAKAFIASGGSNK